MQKVRNIVARTPLIFRVASLYVLMYFIITITTLAIQLVGESYYIVPAVYHKPVVYGDIVLKKIIDGQPMEFFVERLNIMLPIKNGTYSADIGGWTLSDDAVFYAQMTALPNNQRGSTLIYGHNQDKVIARLSDLQIGDVATITTDNGHIFKYTYVSDAVVPPDMTTILYDNPDQPRLTVMTCEGIWSQARRLMYFNLVEAEQDGINHIKSPFNICGSNFVYIRYFANIY